MSVHTPLNKNNSAIKRILQEAKELANDSCTDYTAAPLEDDIFEWHCTIRGPSGTEFEGGLYHFRILLPSEYPFRPPSIIMLTPNGRFELNNKICISFTSYHEESWQPAWGVRTAILGLQGFFPLKGKAALGVGGLDAPISDRKRLAVLSRNWVCSRCEQSNLECLPDVPLAPASSQPSADVTLSAATSEVSYGVISSSLDLQEPESSPEAPLSVPVQPDSSDRPVGSTHSNTPEAGSNTTNYPPSIIVTNSSSRNLRPPLLLDTAICVLLVLVCALICRRVL